MAFTSRKRTAWVHAVRLNVRKVRMGIRWAYSRYSRPVVKIDTTKLDFFCVTAPCSLILSYRGG